ncbi:MAG: hypothetical protein E4H16_03280, partial [Candidatus Atribacteria bacterium]
MLSGDWGAGSQEADKKLLFALSVQKADKKCKPFQYKKGKSKRSSRGVAVENCTDIFWPKMAFPLSLAMSLAYAGKGIE